jgi:hypothetical protein
MDRDDPKNRGERKCPDARRATGWTFALAALSFQPDQETEGKSNSEIEPRFSHQSSNLSSAFTEG